ncbi:MAG: pilus assembly protein, partial [Synergistaceae bacterium]|nr:pilus assembly protein [Synergistaceae bacterium]
MNRKLIASFKRSTAVLIIASFMSQVSFPALDGISRAWAAAPVVEAKLKSDMALSLEDQNKTSLQKPNLLFLIEATEIMSFTPRGVQPQVWRDALFDVHWEETADWKLTKEKYGYTIYDINRIMKEATFGMGAMPPAWRGGDLAQGRNLYGRERDSSNNFVKGKNLAEDIELNKDNYYFPFADPEYAKKNLVGAYSHQFTPLEIEYTNYPRVWPDNILPREYRYGQQGRAGYDYYHGPGHNHPNTNDANNYDGDSVLASYSYRSATSAPKAYPYALVFKNPAHWAKPPALWTEDDLVPNDSRMYQTKLVLWNLLSDKERFKDVRVGMATTFLSPANLERTARKRSQHHHEIAWDQNPDTNGIFKVFPFGANIRTKSYFLSEREGGDAYVKDLGPRNNSNWSAENVYRRKELPVTIRTDWDGFNTEWTRDGDLYQRVQYENGAMHGPSTGEVEAFFHVHGQHYPLWHNATTHAQYMTPNDDGSEPDGWWSNGAVPNRTGQGVSDSKGWFEGTKTDNSPNTARRHENDLVDMGTFNERYARALGKGLHSAGEAWDRPLFKILRRASLWVPIQERDYVWRKGGAAVNHIDKIRLWINGLADIRSDGNYETDWNENSWAFHGRHLTGSYRNSQFHVYNDPEIGVAGMFGLAQAIFPDPTPLDYTPGHTRQLYPGDRRLELDRDYYRRRGWVWYSKRDANIDYTYDYRRASQEYDDTAVPRARFNQGSGEATGSVLDFFSPKINYRFQGTNTVRTDEDFISVSQPQIKDSNGRNSIETTDLHRVSFPIRSACEDNWLIVVASGSEPKIVDKNAYSYNAWEAIKNLYDATDKRNKGKGIPFYNDTRPNHGARKAAYEPVTRIKPGVFIKNPNVGTERGRPLSTGDLETIDLDNPIRTLVIGIVANENDPGVIAAGSKVVEEVKNMRLNLIRMANAGQGSLTGEQIANLNFDNMYKAPIQPYWADNVAALKVAFDAALGMVQIAENPKRAPGAMVEQRIGSGAENSKLFSATNQVVYSNQWNGTLRRYLPVIKDGAVVSIDTAGSWELGDKLLSKRGSGGAPGGVKPMYWVPGGGFKELSQSDATSLNIFGLKGKLITINTAQSQLPPNEALYRWLVGYDHSYVNNRSFRRAHMLADFGQSGIALAANTGKSFDSLPGYIAWAQRQSDANQPMLYGQTNDGLLYVVDPQKGEPEKIILPPPSLLPMRLASLKTMPGANGNRVWIEVVTEDGKGGGKRSLPGFVLDGSLQVRNLDLGSKQSHDWRQYMLGTLGRGGKGFYMMDVSDHKNPKFKWYIEKYGNQMVSMNESTPFNAPKWLDLSAFSGNDAAWRKLGYNGAKPAMGVTLGDDDKDNPQTRNIIVVPGGLQSRIDLANNGNEGAVLIILDPKDGGIIKAFDGDILDKTQTSNWKAGNSVVGRTPYMGMIASEPTLMGSRNASSKFAGYITGRAYTADNRGNIFEVVMENNDGS